MNNNRKIYKFVAIIFIIIGIVVAIASSIIINITTVPKEDRVYVYAVIKKIEEYGIDEEDLTHEVYVEYYINNKKYTEELNYYSSNMYEGQELKIYYDKNNVKRISTDSADKVTILFIVAPIVFSIIGLCLYIPVLLPLIKEKNKNDT